jgi:hypothetical protein
MMIGIRDSRYAGGGSSGSAKIAAQDKTNAMADLIIYPYNVGRLSN